MKYFFGSAQELKDRFLRVLDKAADADAPLEFYWRDDDAISDTPSLRHLIQLSNSHNLPLALAVISRDFDDRLIALLSQSPTISVFQHGWAHENHEPPGSLKAELGDTPEIKITLDRLTKGRDLLADAFGRQFLPVLVPPWNRISPDVLERRFEIGLPGSSIYRRKKEHQRHTVNTHLDVIAWRAGRQFIGEKRAWRRLLVEAVRRSNGHNEPIGILTHHLVHSQEVWDFLALLFDMLSHHPGAVFPDHKAVFEL